LDNPEIERHLAFQDYPQTFTSGAEEYGNLKGKLSQCLPNDISSYIEGEQQLTMEIEGRGCETRQALGFEPTEV